VIRSAKVMRHKQMIAPVARMSERRPQVAEYEIATGGMENLQRRSV